MTDRSFLSDSNLRQVALPEGCPFQAVGLALGKGNLPLEVVVTTSTSEPPLPTLRSCWKARNANRPAPLLFIVLYGDQVGLCGATGDDPPAYVGLDPGQVERICREALEQSDRHAALRSLRDSLPAVESLMPGVRNEGLLATHELITGVRERSDWKSAGDKARRILSKGGEDLLRALGFQIERHDQMTSILRSGDRKCSVSKESGQIQGMK